MRFTLIWLRTLRFLKLLSLKISSNTFSLRPRSNNPKRNYNKLKKESKTYGQKKSRKPKNPQRLWCTKMSNMKLTIGYSVKNVTSGAKLIKAKVIYSKRCKWDKNLTVKKWRNNALEKIKWTKIYLPWRSIDNLFFISF